ncbi:hypothetical protein JCM3766R1_001369, partial [Sporobolomyces carnicolor]
GQKSLFKLSSNKNRSKSSTTSTVTSGVGGGGGSAVGSGVGVEGLASHHHLGGGGAQSTSTGNGSASNGAGGGAGGSGHHYASSGSSGAAGTAGGADFAFGEGSETGFLFVPNIPFELDYLQVLTTTCDTLIQVYSKISTYLGGGGGGGPSRNGAPSSSSSLGGGALSQSLAEVVVKIDTKLKKLIGVLSKEIDNSARVAIKHELDILGGGIEGWGFYDTTSTASSVTDALV